MEKYKSHAVSAQRIEPNDSADNFPTPPWATRALFEHVLKGHVLPDLAALATMSCLEPACGEGHLAKVLQDYFGEVVASDAYDYGFAPVRDFIQTPYSPNSADWVITNPPFRLAEKFIHSGLIVGSRGVAVLVRTSFREGIGRYKRLFRDNPPTLRPIQ
jgi:hypothetical protein